MFGDARYISALPFRRPVMLPPGPAPVPTVPSTPHPARQFTRFAAVGPLGVALGAVQYESLWLLNPVASHRAASTWIISSAIGVLWVHALHCRVTFGDTARGRWRATLGRAYVLYASSIALGALGMSLLVDHAGFRRTPAWFLTSTLASIFNFVFLRRMLGLHDGESPHRDGPSAPLAN